MVQGLGGDGGSRPTGREAAPGAGGLDADLAGRVVLTTVKQAREAASESILEKALAKGLNWSRRSSIWPMFFGTACCFVEFATAGTARYDLARFGSEVIRASPRQADLMLIAGTVTRKMLPLVVRLYHQMAEPKYVIAMGACSISGGPFREGYNVVPGIDRFLPVDVYLPGCPPRPEALMHALMTLQRKIDGMSFREVRWPKGHDARTFPVPELRTDVVDPRATLEEAREPEQPPAPVELAAPAESGRRRPARAAEPEPAPVPVGNFGVAGDAETLAGVRAAFPEAGTGRDGSATLPVGRILEVARHLKGKLGWDFLSNVTSVDFPDRFEVVAHLYSTRRTGPPLVLRTSLDKADPTMPSLVPVWPGANLQEREVYDMMGIRFAGHPNPKRLFLWDEFVGHPLRKDYREPAFEAMTKPFDSRWPDGRYVPGPPRLDPLPRSAASLVPTDDLTRGAPVVDAGELTHGLPVGERLAVYFGPQHPSTHGVFQILVTLEGETIAGLQPVIGYLHRNHEKIGERNGWLQNIPYTDRLDYLTSMSNNLPYVLAVEKLLGVQVPERAEYIRVIMAELTRVLNHLLAIATYTNDIGAYYTPAMYGFEERELILDLFEMASGARMMCNYMRFGGVANDLPEEFLPLARELVNERLTRSVDELDRLVTKNEVLLARSRGIGVLTAEQAVAHSATGPVLRASGVKYDVRKAEPYSIYDRFDFDVPTGTHGDNYDRYLVRLAEIRESIRILKQALRDIPEGETFAGRRAWQIRVPKGEAYGRVEAPKGELGFYVVSDGGPNPYRYHIRSASLMNITALETMCRGHKVADFIAIFGSIDINMGELDR